MKRTSNHAFSTLNDWLADDQSGWLCTVIKTWGSAPMPKGSIMVFSPDAGVIGSLSGGCIEEDLLRQMSDGTLQTRFEQDSKPLLMVYGSNEEEQRRFSLPCGGQLHILVEYIIPTSENRRHFCLLNDALSRRIPVTRRVSMTDTHVEAITGETSSGITLTDGFMRQGFCPDFQMLLVGAGEISRCVAELAKLVDFRVSVWDFREDFIKGWNVEGVALIEQPIEQMIKERFSDQYNAIITLAHDPRLDDIVLMDALLTDAFYIGALGSEKTTRSRRERLLSLLDDTENLQKLHAPVGIRIGSKTPYEIAISILAEVISARAELVNKGFQQASDSLRI